MTAQDIADVEAAALRDNRLFLNAIGKTLTQHKMDSYLHVVSSKSDL